MNSKLRVSDELKNRLLTWRDRKDINKYIAENSVHYKELLVKRSQLKEIVSKAISEYLINKELADMCTRFPKVCSLAGSISISGEDLDITEKTFGDDKISVSTTIFLEDVTWPLEVSNWKHTVHVDKSYLSKIPEKELQVIRDLTYSTIETMYELEKDLRTDEGVIISDYLETFNHLYKYDEDLYKHIIVNNYGENYLVYDTNEDSSEDDNAGPNLVAIKAKNRDKNKEILEKLQTIIDL